jgi:hypothetical protein
MQRADSSEARCGNCGQQLTSEACSSELLHGPVCAECCAIERAGFRSIGIGALAIILIWALLQVLYHKGLVGERFHGLIWLGWAPVWFFICLMGVYFRLRKRKRLLR